MKKVGDFNMRSIFLGTSDFKKIIEGNGLFIDKSLFIDEILKSNAEVQLFTRPRRFGKTTNLSMFRYFFDVQEAETNRVLFNNLNIEKMDNMRHFGRYPVIYITFKDVRKSTAKENINFVKRIFSWVYDDHKYLLEFLDKKRRIYFESIWLEKENFDCSEALRNLTVFLNEYWNEKVIILIDEYDTPLIEAYVEGYYDEVIKFYKILYSSALKDNRYLKKGIITGINRIAKEGIFSGLNNLSVHTVLGNDFREFYGFTEDEVKETLKEYELEYMFEEIRYWYDGYNFGGINMYNPWSFTYYIINRKLRPYWINTSGDSLIADSLRKFEGKGIADSMEKLFKGESIKATVDENIKFKDLTTPNQLWNLMINAGYLTAVDNSDFKKCMLRIPNYEIESYFSDIFIERLVKENTSFYEVLDALVTGNIELFEKELTENILQSVSYMENSKESFYQGYFLCFLSGLKRTHYVRGNRESGYGRYDLYIEPRKKNGYGYIMELKVADREEKLEKEAEKGLNQIEELRYYAELKSRNIENIILISIAFYNKRICIKSRKER